MINFGNAILLKHFMISSTDSRSLYGQFIKQNWQIVYALILFVIVSVIIIVNTVFIWQRFHSLIDTELRHSALTLGQMFSAVTQKIDSSDPLIQQERLQAAAASLSGITSLDILTPKGADFLVIASLYESSVGRIVQDGQIRQAWNENQTFTYSTKNPRSVATDPEPTPDELRKSDCCWGAIVPLRDDSGKIEGLLSVKLSSSHLANLLSAAKFWSVAWLIMTLLIVGLILSSNTHLFQYAKLWQKLRSAEKMKADFIALATHELQTPVTALHGQLSLLREQTFGQLKNNQSMMLDAAQSLTQRLYKLIDDLLTVLRLKKDDLTFKQESIFIEDVIKAIVIESHPIAAAKSIKFEYQLPSRPLPRINVDRIQFKRALTYLCTDIIKSARRGKVTISGSLNDAGRAEINITGPGNSSVTEQLEQSFSKFWNQKIERADDTIGLGLELWIAKQIIEKMDGKIIVDSIEKVGTRISLIFPIIEPLSEEKVDQPPKTMPIKRHPKKKAIPISTNTIFLEEKGEDLFIDEIKTVSSKNDAK
jgi:signal transduction histidine kinase